jgi:pimeloyl-ACP methyl ester carboxylesterase
LIAPLRAISYDRRGFGETVCTKERYSRVVDLISVLDACDIQEAVLVGNSQGGRVAIDAALSHPDRVRALVLIGTAVSGAPDVASFPVATQQLIDRLDAAESAGDLNTLNRLEAHLWLDGPTALEGRVGGTARALFLDMNSRALHADDPGEVSDDIDAWNLLPTLTVPVLIQIGDLDLLHLQDRSKAMATTIVDAELAVFDGCAHMPALEDAPRCARLIADFIGRRRLL